MIMDLLSLDPWAFCSVCSSLKGKNADVFIGNLVLANLPCSCPKFSTSLGIVARVAQVGWTENMQRTAVFLAVGKGVARIC